LHGRILEDSDQCEAGKALDVKTSSQLGCDSVVLSTNTDMGTSRKRAGKKMKSSFDQAATHSNCLLTILLPEGTTERPSCRTPPMLRSQKKGKRRNRCIACRPLSASYWAPCPPCSSQTQLKKYTEGRERDRYRRREEASVQFGRLRGKRERQAHLVIKMNSCDCHSPSFSP
jgi:hypothetical protein